MNTLCLKFIYEMNYFIIKLNIIPCHPCDADVTATETKYSLLINKFSHHYILQLN